MNKLDEIKARLAASTPGPWYFHDSTLYRGPLGIAFDIATGLCEWDPRDFDRDEGVLGVWQEPEDYTRIARTSDAGHARANATLIAHAPTDLAALVKAVEEVRAAREDGTLSVVDLALRIDDAFAPLLTTPERTAPPQGEERGA
jgi:hypothetical protein